MTKKKKKSKKRHVIKVRKIPPDLLIIPIEDLPPVPALVDIVEAIKSEQVAEIVFKKPLKPTLWERLGNWFSD